MEKVEKLEVRFIIERNVAFNKKKLKEMIEKMIRSLPQDFKLIDVK